MSSEKLTEIERKTYEFIKSAGGIHPRDMPDRNMVGAISTLKHEDSWKSTEAIPVHIKKRRRNS